MCAKENCHHSSSFSPSSSSLVFCSFSRQWYLRVYFAFSPCLSLSPSPSSSSLVKRRMSKCKNDFILEFAQQRSGEKREQERRKNLETNKWHCIIEEKLFFDDSISRFIERELIFLIFLITHCLSNWYSSFYSCQRKKQKKTAWIQTLDINIDRIRQIIDEQWQSK